MSLSLYNVVFLRITRAEKRHSDKASCNFSILTMGRLLNKSTFYPFQIPSFYYAFGYSLTFCFIS